MDTSEEYIKMCEKAEEYLDQHWKTRKGDFYGWYSSEYQFNVLERDIPEDHPDQASFSMSSQYWLPRQDQLQDIIGNYPEQVYDFYNYISGNTGGWGSDSFADPSIYEEYSSLEQLWLAFVMKEKFNKVWTGEDWEELQWN